MQETPRAAAETPNVAATAAAAPPRSSRLVLLVPVLIFAALAGLFAFALRTGDPSKLPSALIGKPAPRLALAAVDELFDGANPVVGLTGKELASGQPVVVNFFASWCLPCVDEHPQLVRLKQLTGVPIYGINHKDLAANARKFLVRHGNPYAAVGADGNGRAAIEWGVYGMPETFVVDGKGIVTFKHVGPISPAILKDKIIPALEAARKSGA